MRLCGASELYEIHFIMPRLEAEASLEFRDQIRWIGKSGVWGGVPLWLLTVFDILGLRDIVRTSSGVVMQRFHLHKKPARNMVVEK